MSSGRVRFATREWTHGIVAVATVMVVFSASCHTALGLPRHVAHDSRQCRQHTLTELARSPALIMKDASMPRMPDAALLVTPFLLLFLIARSCDDGRLADIRVRIRRLAWVWARGSPIAARFFIPRYAPRSETV